MCFSLEKDYVLVKLCDRMGHFDMIIKAAEHLYLNEMNSKNLCLIAVLFLKYLTTKNSCRPCESFNESSDGLLSPLYMNDLKKEEDKSETDTCLEGLNLCQKIVSKALLKAGEDDILAIQEVVNWVNTCYYLTKRDNPIQDQLYKNFYTPDSCIASFNTFSTIKEVFEICTAFVGKYHYFL